MMTQNGLNMIRGYVKDRIVRAVYTNNGEDVSTEDVTGELLADGRVAISFTLDASEGVELTRVRFYDENDVLWADRTEDITQDATPGGILYRARITIEEEENDV